MSSTSSPGLAGSSCRRRRGELQTKTPQLEPGCPREALDLELLLEGFGVRGVLRRLLVQIRNQFLSGGRNGDSTLEHDGFCFDLLAIDALIAVIVRANRGAFQREAGEQAAGAGIAQDL